MAKETLVEQASVRGLGLHLGNGDHTAWDSSSASEQMKLINDDLLAGRNVSIVIFSSISIGLLLTIVTVLIVLRSI